MGSSVSGNRASNRFSDSRRDVAGPFVMNYQMHGSDSDCSPGRGERGSASGLHGQEGLRWDKVGVGMRLVFEVLLQG